MSPAPASGDLLRRYQQALLPVFGTPQIVLSHGSGCYVVDVDGNRYLDLLAGIAVNTLGHAHPAIVAAVTEQVGKLVHISNFFTSPPQVELAEELLRICRAPEGSAVFLANSGTEANEAAIKLTRRTGRRRLIAAENAFHGRTTGALAITWKPAYREPFEPLLPEVSHVPFGDGAALAAAVEEAGGDLAAVILEPIQGEAGVVVADPDYLRLARELTTRAGALLVLDEIQSGMGRTGSWLAHHPAGIVPDAVTLAKGLAAGVPHRGARHLRAGDDGSAHGRYARQHLRRQSVGVRRRAGDHRDDRDRRTARSCRPDGGAARLRSSRPQPPADRAGPRPGPVARDRVHRTRRRRPAPEVPGGRLHRQRADPDSTPAGATARRRAG